MIGLLVTATLAIEAAPNSRVEGVTPQEKLSRSILNRYAECLLDADGRAIRAMLFGDPNSGTFERWRKRLNAFCMLSGRDPYYINPDNVTLRFALAEVIVRDLKGGPAVLNVSEIPPLSQPERPVGKDESQSFYAFASRLGECLVRRDGHGTAALLRTEFATEEERAAIGALLAGARTCMTLPPGGLKIDTISFRGAIALNYVRLAREAERTASGKPEAAE
jgi:hypothetical protein